MSAPEPTGQDAVPWAYGLLARCYPRTWNGRNQRDEVLAIMLDAADAEGRRRPSAGEVWDAVRHGVQVRLRFLDIALPPAVRIRVAQLSLVLATAFAAFSLLFGELRIPGLSAGDVSPDLTGGMNPPGHPFMTLGVLAYAGWIGMLVLYLIGRPRAYRYLGAVTLAVTWLLPVIAGAAGRQRPPGTLLIMLGLLNLLALLPGRREPVVRRTRLLIIAGTSAAALALIARRLYGYHDFAHGTADTSRWGFYWGSAGFFGPGNFSAPDVAQFVVPVGVAGALVIALLAWRWDRAWLPAVAIVSVPFVLLRVVYTQRPGAYGHLRLDRAQALTELLAWSGLVLLLVAVCSVLNRFKSRNGREGERIGATDRS